MNYFERAKKFRAKKRLGQNFLTDEKAVETILDVSDITKEDVVVEIGPGLGFVTEHLVNLAKKVYAVELDEDMVNEISKIDADNLEIIHNDILKTDLSQFGSNLKIVANIPYYITSPILAHLLGEVNGIVEMLNKCGEFNVSSNPNERRVKFSELREDEVCESMDIDTAFQDINSRIKDYYAVDKVVDL